MVDEKNRHRNLAVCVGLAVLTLIAFWQAIHAQFVAFDDGLYVTRNPHLQLSPANITWAFTSSYAGNWHPLTWLSHMVDVQLFGLNPKGHHLTNLLLHVLNTILLYLFLARYTARLWPAAFVAALFAIHPLHVESVAWISERKDLLSTTFCILTLWAYARYVHRVSQAPPSVTHSGLALPRFRADASKTYLLALAFFALGLMSKPMLVTVPFLLLLLDFWPLNRFRSSTPNQSSTAAADPTSQPVTWRSLVYEKIPFFGLALLVSTITFQVQEQGHAFLLQLPFTSRLANAFVSYAKYLGKTFWPTDLAVFYPHPDTRYPQSSQWPLPFVLLTALALLAISLFVWWRRSRLPWVFTGWFWFIGTLVPVIGIVQVGTQAMADRYTYLPLVGIFIALVWSASELLTRVPAFRLPLVGLGCAALLICLPLTARQVGYWQDTSHLFEHALQVAPDNAPAHFHLGSIAGGNGRFDLASAHFQAAIKADPSYSDAYYSLGLLLEGIGKRQEAIELYRAGLSVAPWHSLLHNRLGMAYWAAGQRNDALEQCAEAVRLSPELADAHYNLGMMFYAMGNSEQAAKHLLQAVRLNPEDAESLNRLAWLLATSPNDSLRNGSDAVKLAQRACDKDQAGQLRYRVTLAAAYAEAGRFDQAISTSENILNLAQQQGQTNLVASIESKLSLYRAHQPFHESSMVTNAPAEKSHTPDPVQ